ncbi:hypothetical protein CN692_16630 [Bacillus sp. AFS002410]|uniref:hypothetical protein n=1 Tax=Bacillus sp. AFS002410 TaxID=2033481 RepID=UPI000BF19A59|nr:hypothetical protein [Bacillus sp. AFS002410]PEJ56634.1 hypothetical protein CN692_16630 [Bacillus sp. AFS002410]
MKKTSHLKKIIILITLFLLSCLLLVKCNIPDNERDQISIKKLNLKYVKENDPDFFIESIRVNSNDKRLGNPVELKSADYGWMLDLLLENKKEIYNERKSNTYKVKLTFMEYGWTFEHETSRYDGKQSTFYISQKLQKQFIQQYLASYPRNIILTKKKYNWDEKIEGKITIAKYTSLDQGLILALSGSNDGDGSDFPIKIADLFSKNTKSNDEVITIPFSFKISDYQKKLRDSNQVYIELISTDGTLVYVDDKVPLRTK